MNDTDSSTSKDTELTPGTTEYTPAASEYAPSTVLSLIQDGLGRGWSTNQTLRSRVKDDAQKDADYWRNGISALMDQNQELSYDDANNLLQHRFLCVYGTMALIEQYYADARAAGYGADDPPLSSDALNALQAQRPGATHRTEKLLSELPDHHDRVKNFKLTMSGLNELRTRMASSTLPDLDHFCLTNDHITARDLIDDVLNVHDDIMQGAYPDIPYAVGILPCHCPVE